MPSEGINTEIKLINMRIYVNDPTKTQAKVRIIIEITAGVIPGMPADEYSRRFIISSEEWYGEGDASTPEKAAQLKHNSEEAVMKMYGYAQEYARSLWNPKIVNWVTTNWLYL
jgi:hypothetical protein